MVLPFLSVEILEEIVTVVAALGLGAVGKLAGQQPPIEKILARFRHKAQPSPTVDLLKRLHSASSEMELVLSELRAAADERSMRVSSLEASINELIEKEKKLQEKVQGAEGISKATVEALAQAVGEKLEQAERPKKRRDYSLFVAGVIVTTVIGIGIEVTKPLWEKMLPIKVQQMMIEDNRGKAVGAPQQTDRPKNPN